MVIRPDDPVPGTWRRSRLFSRAILRTRGEERTRSPVSCRIGFGLRRCFGRSRLRARCAGCRRRRSSGPGGADDGHHVVDLHRGAGLYLDLGKHACGGRGNLGIHFIGRDLEERLVLLHCVAGLFQPLGNRPFENRLAHLGHDHFGEGGRRGCLRRRGRCGSRGVDRAGRVNGFGRRLSRRRRSGGLTIRVPNHAYHGIDLHGVSFRDLDLGEHTTGGRGNLGIHFIGRDFEERLVSLHRVTRLFQPLGDGAFKNRLTHLGHDDIGRHGLPFALRTPYSSAIPRLPWNRKAPDPPALPPTLPAGQRRGQSGEPPRWPSAGAKARDRPRLPCW